MLRDETTLPEPIHRFILDTQLFALSGVTSLTLEFFETKVANPLTKRNYFHALEGFFTWAARNEIEHLEQVTRLDISRYLNGIPRKYKGAHVTLSKSSVAVVRAALRKYFAFLHDHGALPQNPALNVAMPHSDAVPERTPPIGLDDLANLFAVIPRETARDLRDRALIALLAFTACRIGAALKLNHNSIRGTAASRRVHLIEKRSKPHSVPITPDLAAELDPYLDEVFGREGGMVGGQPLFRHWSIQGKRLSSARLNYLEAYRAIARWVEKADIDSRITPHSFRATVVTAMRANGKTLEEARKYVNHTSAETTRGYDGYLDAVTEGEAQDVSDILLSRWTKR